eukprot:gene22457-63087_t
MHSDTPPLPRRRPRRLQPLPPLQRREATAQRRWFIRDRRALEPVTCGQQQREIKLMQERRSFAVTEEEARLIILAEEEMLRPILDEILTSYREYVDICQHYEDVNCDRTSVLKVPPIVHIHPQKGKLRPPRYVAGQIGEQWVTVDNKVRLVTGLPSGWEEQVAEIEQREADARKAQALQAAKQRDISDKHKQVLQANPDQAVVQDRWYLVRMIENAVNRMHKLHAMPMLKRKVSQCIDESRRMSRSANSAAVVQWPSPDELKRRKT